MYIAFNITIVPCEGGDTNEYSYRIITFDTDFNKFKMKLREKFNDDSIEGNDTKELKQYIYKNYNVRDPYTVGVYDLVDERKSNFFTIYHIEPVNDSEYFYFINDNDYCEYTYDINELECILSQDFFKFIKRDDLFITMKYEGTEEYEGYEFEDFDNEKATDILLNEYIKNDLDTITNFLNTREWNIQFIIIKNNEIIYNFNNTVNKNISNKKKINLANISIYE